MTRVSTALVSCAAIALVVLVAGDRPAAQQVFRASTDAVSITVAVRRGSTPITSLGTSDFALTDNGVAQKIEALSLESVPVDLTLVLDASSSTAEAIARFKSSAETVAQMLRDRDRVRLIAFSTEVVEVFPMTPAGERLPMNRLLSSGTTALHDALLLALVRRPEPGRRQLVVAFSDGVDTSSVVTASTLADIARRSDCALHLVLSGSPDSFPPTIRSLRDAAEATGGTVHAPGQFHDAVSALRRVLNDFRQSYVLRYTVSGVDANGWHDVDVRVTAPDSDRYVVSRAAGIFRRLARSLGQTPTLCPQA